MTHNGHAPLDYTHVVYRYYMQMIIFCLFIIKLREKIVNKKTFFFLRFGETDAEPNPHQIRHNPCSLNQGVVHFLFLFPFVGGDLRTISSGSVGLSGWKGLLFKTNSVHDCEHVRASHGWQPIHPDRPSSSRRPGDNNSDSRDTVRAVSAAAVVQIIGHYVESYS